LINASILLASGLLRLGQLSTCFLDFEVHVGFFTIAVLPMIFAVVGIRPIYLASHKAPDATNCAQICDEHDGDSLVIWDYAAQPSLVWTVGSLLSLLECLV